MDLKKLEGRPAIVIFEQDKMGPFSLAWIKQHFARVGELEPVEVKGDGLQTRKVYLLRCHGYSYSGFNIR